MPGFHPKVSKYELEENPKAGILKEMSVFGKISYNNVGCALTNTHLHNTGNK